MVNKTYKVIGPIDVSKKAREEAKLKSNREYKQFQLNMLELIHKESPELFEHFLTSKHIEQGKII